MRYLYASNADSDCCGSLDGRQGMSARSKEISDGHVAAVLAAAERCQIVYFFRAKNFGIAPMVNLKIFGCIACSATKSVPCKGKFAFCVPLRRTDVFFVGHLLPSCFSGISVLQIGYGVNTCSTKKRKAADRSRPCDRDKIACEITRCDRSMEANSRGQAYPFRGRPAHPRQISFSSTFVMVRRDAVRSGRLWLARVSSGEFRSDRGGKVVANVAAFPIYREVI